MSLWCSAACIFICVDRKVVATVKCNELLFWCRSVESAQTTIYLELQMLDALSVEAFSDIRLVHIHSTHTHSTLNSLSFFVVYSSWEKIVHVHTMFLAYTPQFILWLGHNFG